MVSNIESPIAATVYVFLRLADGVGVTESSAPRTWGLVAKRSAKVIFGGDFGGIGRTLPKIFKELLMEAKAIIVAICPDKSRSLALSDIGRQVSPGGFEPPTYSLKGSHSTAELWALSVTPQGLEPWLQG